MNGDAAVLRADRIAGAMLGAAVGDALGAAYEMLPSEAIERHLGSAFATTYEAALPGSLLYGHPAAEPTDDTAMALSVAFALASGEHRTAELFARRFLCDLHPGRGRFAAMFWEGGPGGATMQALRRLKLGADAATNGHRDDGGNGAAMRAHPIGALRDRDEVLGVATMQARVTHGHPAAIAAARAIAALVHDAIEGAPLSLDVPVGVDDALFVRTWHDVHRELVAGTRLPAHLRSVPMSGWATVSTAHAIVVTYDGDPARAIGAAAASGGDTDTVASIVGALVGARYGATALPANWIAELSPDASGFCSHAARLLSRRE